MVDLYVVFGSRMVRIRLPDMGFPMKGQSFPNGGKASVWFWQPNGRLLVGLPVDGLLRCPHARPPVAVRPAACAKAGSADCPWSSGCWCTIGGFCGRKWAATPVVGINGNARPNKWQREAK